MVVVAHGGYNTDGDNSGSGRGADVLTQGAMVVMW